MAKNELSNLMSFFDSHVQKRYERGDVVIYANEEPSGVYFVKEGYVKMSTISKEGTELTLNIFKPGSYFPLMWAIGGMDNEYDYGTLTHSSLIKVSKDELIAFIEDKPEVLMDLSRRTVIGLGGLVQRMRNLLYGNARERVVSSLVISAKRFGEKQKNGEVVIKLPLSHQDVGDLSSLTRETTSIEMKKLNNEGIISYKRRYVVILDMGRLEKELEFTIFNETAVT